MTVPDHLLRAALIVLGALALLLTLAATPGCRPAAASGQVPPPDPGAAALVADVERLHQRVEAHEIYFLGRESWLRVPVSPEPPPPRWWTGTGRRDGR